MIPRSFPKHRSARRSSARRVNRRAAAFSLAVAAMLASVLPFGQRAQAADTVTTVIAGATNLSDPNSYNPTGAPTATNDVLFTGTYTTPTFNVNGAALTYGTLDDISTQALTIGDTAGTPGSITLSSVANLTTSTGAGNAADVLFVKSGSTLTINNVTVNIGVTAGNNINTGGTLTFGATSTLTLGAGATTTFSGAGTTTINGNINGAAANTAGGVMLAAGTLTLAGTNAFTGATTLTAGTLNLNSATALGTLDPTFGTPVGTSGLNLNGGTLNNTSGAAVALTYSAPITFGNFTFGTTASTSANNLNLGTGAISLAGSRTLTFAGAGNTLTMGGVLSNTTTGSVVLNLMTPAGSQSIAGAAGDVLVLGGIALNSNTSTTAATTITVANNSGPVLTPSLTVTGAVTNGNSFANNLTIAPSVSSGTYTFGGNNT